MNADQNPCFVEATSPAPLATTFTSPTLGCIALPTSLVASVQSPHDDLLTVSYPGVTIKVQGRNLGNLLDRLSNHRLMALTAVDEANYRFSAADVFISDIEVSITK